MAVVNVAGVIADISAVLARVEAGEAITIERDGRPIAPLTPASRRDPDPTQMDRWRNLPQVDAATLRAISTRSSAR